MVKTSRSSADRSGGTRARAGARAVLVHPRAICEANAVGAGTRIWAFAHILPNARIGKDCNICDGVFIENDVHVGDGVTIKCGVQLWDGVTLEDHVFIGPNVTFTNDPFPRSQAYRKEPLRTLVRKHASIGANATLLPGISIGENAMVGAGSVVTESVPANAIVFGNPARVVGYVNARNAEGEVVSQVRSDDSEPPVRQTAVKGVTLHRLRSLDRLPGRLVSAEFTKQIPFRPKRYLVLLDLPVEKAQGQYACRNCHQFLVCVKGSCAVLVDDGVNRREVGMEGPDRGLYLPPMIWAMQYRFTSDAVLLVFASEYDDTKDYIREYGQFLREVGLQRAPHQCGVR